MTSSGGSLTDNEYRALAQFRHALRVFLRFSEHAARAEGLPPSQHQLLLAIRGSRSAGAPSISDVAELLQRKNHSVVGLADRADEAGLIRSEIDPNDARRRLLHLTATGEAVLERLSALHRSELRRFRDEMTDVLQELD